MPRAKKAPDMPTDRLEAMLARLKLSGIRDGLDSLLDEAARANLSARETLLMLCEREIARKDHRRIETALKLADFPAVEELAGFVKPCAMDEKSKRPCSKFRCRRRAQDRVAAVSRHTGGLRP